VAVVLLLLVPIAAFADEGEDALGDLLLFFWVVAMLVIAIVVAGRVAGARRTRFVDSLYTTPLEQGTWLAAQAIVGAFLVLLILLPMTPVVLVHLALVGMPAQLPGLLLAALAMGAFAVALGLFCGVVVGEAGAGAAAGLAGGLSFLSFVLFLVHGMAASGMSPGVQAVLLRVTALSPLTLVLDAVGASPFDAVPRETWRPVVGFAAMVGGLGAAAWFAYTRAQGPLGWDRPGGRLVVVALVALALVAPVATAATLYQEDEDGEDLWSYAHGERTRIGFVSPGQPIDDEAFTIDGFLSVEELTMGEDLALDVLVMVHAPEGARVRDVRVAIAGSDRVQVVAGGQVHVADGQPDGQARPTVGYEDGPEPDAPLRPVYRVPVTLRPLEVASLMGSYAPITINTTFLANGEAHASRARISLETNVPHASAIVAAATAPLPLAALGALARRKLTTR
jgi:hypothetical protein